MLKADRSVALGVRRRAEPLVRDLPGSQASCNTGTCMQIIFGIHAVEEALAARGRGFEYVAVVPTRGDARIQKIVQLCRTTGVPLRTLPPDPLTLLPKTPTHHTLVPITS